MVASTEVDGERVDVEIIDRESHHGFEAVQVRAVDEGVSITDQSGEQPWVPEEEIDD